jgi:hypothetical protein
MIDKVKYMAPASNLGVTASNRGLVSPIKRFKGVKFGVVVGGIVGRVTECTGSDIKLL